MPDGDVFTRSVQPRWRRLAAALRDERPLEECAIVLEETLAGHLRATGGLGDVHLERLLRQVGDGLDEFSVQAALSQLARRNAFDRVVPLLVGHGRYSNFDAAQRFIHACLDTARLDVVARSLVRRPDAVGLRRPRQRRTPTGELLSENAPLGEHA